MSGLIYIGRGAFLPGIPARDLSADEVELHGEDALLATGLYAEPRPTKAQLQRYENKAARGPSETKEV